MRKRLSHRLVETMKNEAFRREFGQRIKVLRKQKSWTQRELARRLDVRYQQLNKYECGLHIPPAEKLVELSELLDTTVDFLFTGRHEEIQPLHNRRLLERFRALQKFATEDQETVIRLIDAMIIKQRVEGALEPVDRQAS